MPGPTEGAHSPGALLRGCPPRRLRHGELPRRVERLDGDVRHTAPSSTFAARSTPSWPWRAVYPISGTGSDALDAAAQRRTRLIVGGAMGREAGQLRPGQTMRRVGRGWPRMSCGA